MLTSFQTYLQSHASFTDSELEDICATAIQRTLQRNESLLQEGQVCRHKIFVIKGILRNFATVADGSEHILQFSPENTWTLDVESYDKQTPSQFNIAAVERSEVLLWAKTDFERLLAEIPKLKTLSQELISRNIYSSRQRILSTLSATPEEKYEEFVNTQPGLPARLPLHMIASYLGISLKTLTRIRHAQSHR
ncbi:Crp/Fnr family transcriptional regulator [Taibaiella soli]|uniref:Cyclic nucleotide-binding protein n=1 Tax=Taibaiella soli TaxID=1649169 RepID=A0A2W2AAL3_9BACT|nr:Crp/Fnr family transcriptional regulator [Taibaiella soli]PZF72321.1 cyclic nucleotide-binding protein [Taibaiella soli]